MAAKNSDSFLSIVGARPQFIKASVVHNALREQEVPFRVLHTGQHYDSNMSQVFFTELGQPAPEINLEVGSGTHGAMTGRMLERIEEILLESPPRGVIVYGDTNSTLAGALAAAKLNIPLAHVEAGLRSFNKAMPEEINRITCDHVSSLLLCPTEVAMKNLAAEGISENVLVTGDVMYDAVCHFRERASKQSTIVEDLELSPRNYILTSIHRAESTNSESRLTEIFKALQHLAQQERVVLPLHPRTQAALKQYRLDSLLQGLSVLEPQSYLDMLMLQQNARVIATDSGGMQKEAYFHRVPCITLRDETEWVESVDAGWNTLVGADREQIVHASLNASQGEEVDLYGDGNAAAHVVNALLRHF